MSGTCNSASGDGERERRLDAAVAHYLQMLARGTVLDRQQWLAEYAELAPELSEFLDDLDRVSSAVSPLRPNFEIPSGFSRQSPTESTTPEGNSPTTGASLSKVIAGRYSLIEKIGEGGMGEVWVAKQTEPIRRRVAIKLIKAGMDSKIIVARFEAERQALALMDHPHIAKVFDGGLTANERLFFVMELVNGLPLVRFCDEATLNIRERLELFILICHAVQHAHQKGIIHRDLKPSNILVTQSDGKPIPKIIDFGVAKATLGKLTDESLATQFGAVVGTLEYMAPEQAAYQTGDVDTRADVYALGVVLYELLTGCRPFDARRLHQAAFDEIVRMIREDEPSKPSTRLSTDEALPSLAAVRRTEPARLTQMLRGDLDWVIMKCLEKQRDRRYATANGLARDIQRYLADETVEARPPSAAYRLRKFVRRNRAGVLASGLLFVALLAGFFGTTISLLSARIAERRALAQTARASAVRDFLIKDLLGQANPEQNPRSEMVTVEQLVERAYEKLGTNPELAEQPELRADVLAVLGDTFEALGNLPQAVACWKSSLELSRQLFGEEDADRTLVAMKGYGQALIGIDRFREAEEVLRQAVAIRRRRSGSEDTETLFAITSLAIAIGEQGRYKEAEELFRECFDTRSRVFGKQQKETLQAMNNYAGALMHQGKYAAADALYSDAAEGYEALGWGDLPEALSGSNGRAINLIYQRKLVDAKRLLTQIIERRSRLIGPHHLLTLGSRTNLGYVLCELGEVESSLQELTSAYDILREEQGPTHRETLAAKNSLVLALRAAKRFDEAERYAQEVVAAARAKVGDHETDLQIFLNNLGWVHEGQGKFADAEREYREGLADAEHSGHGDSPTTWNSSHNLLRVLYVQGRFPEAIMVGQQTLAARKRLLGETHESTLSSGGILARSLLGVGRFDNAEALLQELLGNAGQAPDELVAALWQAVGDCRLGKGQYQAAIEPLRRALALRQRWLAGKWQECDSQSALAEALLKGNSYAEAETLLLAAAGRLDKIRLDLPYEHRQLPDQTRSRLVELYTAWGRPENAAKWYAQD